TCPGGNPRKGGAMRNKKLKTFEAAGCVVLALLLLYAMLPLAATAQANECSFFPAQWTQQFGSPAEDQARGISVDASGVYVVGGTAGSFPRQTRAGGVDS